MSDMFKLDDFKEFHEKKRNREIIIEPRKEKELAYQMDDFLRFIDKGSDLAISESDKEYSFLTFVVNVYRIRNKASALLEAFKDSIEIDWSGFNWPED